MSSQRSEATQHSDPFSTHSVFYSSLKSDSYGYVFLTDIHFDQLSELGYHPVC